MSQDSLVLEGVNSRKIKRTGHDHFGGSEMRQAADIDVITYCLFDASKIHHRMSSILQVLLLKA